jgi:hypothetical protein
MDKDKSKPFVVNHDALLEAVEEHFMNELKVNPVDVIYKFLSTKKDPDLGINSTGYDVRPKTRTARKD